MKTFVAAALLALLAVAGAGQQQPPKKKDAASTETAGESPLVRAAREGKAKRKRSTRKVITNDDVKKATGSVTVNDDGTAVKAAPPAVAPVPDAKAQPDPEQQARQKAEERVKVATKRVSDLEIELNRLQESYRHKRPAAEEEATRKKLEQTKRQLTDARKDLAGAKAALPPPAPPKQ